MSNAIGYASHLQRIRVQVTACDLPPEEMILTAELVDRLMVLDRTGRLTDALVLGTLGSFAGLSALDGPVTELMQAVQARRRAAPS